MSSNPRGKAICNSLRNRIIEELLKSGSNSLTGIVPWGLYIKIGKQFNITKQTIGNIWKLYVETDSVNVRKNQFRNNRRLLSEEDELYVSQQLLISPCLQHKEIRASLLENSNNLKLDGENSVLSNSTISRTIRKRLPHGDYTRKKVRSSNINRWTAANIIATDNFIQLVQTFDISKLRFMDECGFQPSSANRRFYGYGRRGQSIVNVSKHLTGSNVTLNLVLGFDNIVFGTVQETTSDRFSYMNFWHECLEAYTPTGVKVLEPGCVIIVDNCPTHRFQTEAILKPYLATYGIQYHFLPKYSPEMNPPEYCFNTLKNLLKQTPYSQMVSENLPLAILQSLDSISRQNIIGYFKGVTGNYLNI
jgi:transposase